MAGFGGLTGGGVRQAFPWQGRGAFMPTRGLIPLFATGGIAALALPDEAEASPRPKYMEELVRKLETGDFTPMDFGHLSGAQLRKLQRVDPSFTEGPIKLSGRNMEKFAKKRMHDDGMTPQELVDGLNSVFHGSRSRAFPNKQIGNYMLLRPVEEEYAWKGVIAPHDGFSGLVTGYKYPLESMKKELSLSSEGRPSPSYPHIPEEIASREGTLPGRLTTVEDKEKLFDKKIQDKNSFVKSSLPPFMVGAAGGGLAASEAEASETGGTAFLGTPGGGTSAKRPGMAAAPGPSFNDAALRGLSLGTRNVLQGLGSVPDMLLNQPINAIGQLLGYDPGLVNPGKALSDWLGLARPETETERRLSSVIEGVSGAFSPVAGGMGLARLAAGPVARGVGRSLASTPGQDAFLGGLLGYFLGDE